PWVCQPFQNHRPESWRRPAHHAKPVQHCLPVYRSLRSPYKALTLRMGFALTSGTAKTSQPRAWFDLANTGPGLNQYLGSQTWTIHDLVVLAIDHGGQGNIKHDLCKRTIQVFGSDTGRIRVIGQWWHQTVASGVGEVVIHQRITVNIDLRGQLAVARSRHKEVNVRRTVTVAAQLVQQALGRTIRRTAVALGHNALELVE